MRRRTVDRDDERPRLRLAVVAICRNEGPYILEWIAWYKTLGFDRIFVYDNVSDDGTSELLAALHRAGEIERVHWPRRERQNPQRTAYAHFLQFGASGFDWVLVCDIDEFLVVRDHDVRKFIDAAAQEEPKVAAFAIPWLVFGPGGAETHEPGLVIERFTVCDDQPDATVKMMFRPTHVVALRTHICDLAQGVYVDNAFKPASWSTDSPIKLMEPRFGHGLIHHYQTKSREEWVRRRGLPRADRAEIVPRDLALFEQLQQQTASCTSALDMLPEVHNEIARLSSSIAETARETARVETDLLVVHPLCVIGRVKHVPPDTHLRVVLNERHEFVVRPDTDLADGGVAFVVNLKLTGEKKVNHIRMAPIGALDAVVLERESFPTRKETMRNLDGCLPAAEGLRWDYVIKLSGTREGFEWLRAYRLPAFTKHPEYGALIDGLLEHQDDLAGLGRFLDEYEGRYGRAGQGALGRFELDEHFAGGLIHAACVGKVFVSG
jgi:hypothetical protein